jgi:hypothetical protein
MFWSAAKMGESVNKRSRLAEEAPDAERASSRAIGAKGKTPLLAGQVSMNCINCKGKRVPANYFLTANTSLL